MRIWRRTIFTHLFIVFSAIILVAIALFSAVNYVSVNDKLSSQAVSNLVTLSRSLVINIDAQLQNMDRISVTPVFSATLRNLLRRSWRDPAMVTATVDLLTSINGQMRGVSQVNLYNLDGRQLGINSLEGGLANDVRRQPWFEAVQAARGERVITRPHGDKLATGQSVLDRDRRYISLCRSFTDPDTEQSGIIEVEQDCAALFQELDILGRDTLNGRHFAIISDAGAPIYPYAGELADLAWIVGGRPQDISIQVSTSRHPVNGRNYVLAYSHSLESDWCLVIMQDEERLYADVPDFTRQILLYAVLVSLVALLGAFWAARRVSVPLRRLSQEMAGFSLADLSMTVVHPGPVSGLTELDGLGQAFDRLRSQLRQSFAEAVLLRAHKHRAQLLALQSQMNPHFMYNMLATISVMAEEDQAAAIPAIIEDLSEMMRYIASSEETGHTLGSEFDFVRRYLQSMKHRFRDDFEFSLDCPEKLAHIPVPRLVLQPFIENAIKHSTRRRPPWKISLRAKNREIVDRPDAGWLVTIEDNGPGFTADSLVDLQAELARIRALTPDLADLPGLHVEGMGLLNTFIRLHLTYGEAALMEIGNGAPGGARIRIGGASNV